MMRYDSKEDLPKSLRDALPEAAQAVYLSEFQRAWDSYGQENGGEVARAEAAHRQAMSEVARGYIEVDDLWFRRW